ncbi:hypothetical protein PPERSA_02267 [Pseudocohnilembus persalinus]|uniref:Transmembrane protein n=1 Tax=Pseudocohnilembus persalinus TaxID=266149 RepID=A0A0V0QKE2_PSEPJ|nr:hypothetical protein PPERSA_02267 [Pseudocohnilembus persalinus]|eukprot:KRX02777.1 hypothetical protein PPERSA_02267 [Pseudocohnilembus persalinus]
MQESCNKKPQKTNQKQIKDEKITTQKFWKNEIFINIIKLIGYYFDLVTDFLFIYEKYLDIRQKQLNNPTATGLMNTLIILCIHFSIERYKVFKYLCSIQGETIQREQQLDQQSVFVSQIGDYSDFKNLFY